MGWPELAGNGRKIKKLPVAHGGRCRRFGSSIPVRPTAVGLEILPPRSSGGGAPPCPARVQYWWLESALTAETRST